MYTLNILAVDDEPHMRSGISRILNNYKMSLNDVDEPIIFKVDTAETGEEALVKIDEKKPDILLLDYKLPGISGMDVLEKVGTNDENMVAIMITAFASLQTAVSAIKTGAFDFISKPFTPSELKSTVSKAAQSLILARHIKKLNEEKRQIRFQFISVLGHELKAPLSAIEGYLYMFKDKALGELLESYDTMVDRCINRADQMRKLILDILEMTKIESGVRQRELQNLDLNEIVKSSIETFIPDSITKGIQVHYDSNSTINLIADKMEMDIIFNNLISNSIKYNKDNGDVYINLVKNGNQLKISVKDTGIGMSEEEVGRLFNEFVRIKNKKTKDIPGSGLGLSTIKKIAILYGGNISVSSTPDEGSTFEVILFDQDLDLNENP